MYFHTFLEHSAAETIAGLTLSLSNYEEATALLKKRLAVNDSSVHAGAWTENQGIETSDVDLVILHIL